MLKSGELKHKIVRDHHLRHLTIQPTEFEGNGSGDILAETDNFTNNFLKKTCKVGPLTKPSKKLSTIQATIDAYAPASTKASQ